MKLTNTNLSQEERLMRSLSVETTRRGADPSLFLDLLADAVDIQAWERLPSKTFVGFVEQPYPNGIGSTVDTVKTMMRLRHRHEGMDPAVDARMAALRDEVKNLLSPAEGEHGGDRKSEDYQVRNTNLKKQDDADYILRRLKRDEEKYPGLAQRVLKGELSAHAAAVQAGFRPRTITVPLDPEKMARAIRRRLSDDELDVLLEALEAAS